LPLQQWQTVSVVDILEDLPWLKLSADNVKLPSGRHIEKFYQIRLPEYSVIVPVTADGLIVMERQYKHAIGEIVINLPAGYLDTDETPLDAAKRELLEETGFEAPNWVHLGSFCIDGNRGCGSVHAFVAFDARKVTEPLEENTEQLEIFFTKPQDAFKFLVEGRIRSAGPALALSLAFVSPESPLFIPNSKAAV
jgi:ADP-ribose pyrophosphatase